MEGKGDHSHDGTHAHIAATKGDQPVKQRTKGGSGLHVGQDDLPVASVRKLIGSDKIIGLSTHSPEQAHEAILAGADYIGVGPIFATQTKEDVCAPVGFSYLEYVAGNLDIPFVAIGGIKCHNLQEVVSRGARTVCMVTEIVGAGDIGQKICEINAQMALSQPGQKT